MSFYTNLSKKSTLKILYPLHMLSVPFERHWLRTSKLPLHNCIEGKLLLILGNFERCIHDVEKLQFWHIYDVERLQFWHEIKFLSKEYANWLSWLFYHISKEHCFKWFTLLLYVMCKRVSDQQSPRSACAYAQSDHSLCSSFYYSMIVKLLTKQHLEFLSLTKGLHRLVWVYNCQITTLLEITCRSSNLDFFFSCIVHHIVYIMYV